MQRRARDRCFGRCDVRGSGSLKYGVCDTLRVVSAKTSIKHAPRTRQTCTSPSIDPSPLHLAKTILELVGKPNTATYCCRAGTSDTLMYRPPINILGWGCKHHSIQLQYQEQIQRAKRERKITHTEETSHAKHMRAAVRPPPPTHTHTRKGKSAPKRNNTDARNNTTRACHLHTHKKKQSAASIGKRCASFALRA